MTLVMPPRISGIISSPPITVAWTQSVPPQWWCTGIYQSPTCGQLGGGSLAQNQSGAIFRAAKADVDFALVELEDIPDSGFRVYYSGWNRSGAQPGGAVGIHHPNGDEKAISLSTTALTTVNSCIGSGGGATHWQVFWSAGVTESGSSGSGIWDPSTHQLVGTLSGGSVASTNARLTFRHSFDLESSATSATGFDGGVLEISIDGAAFVDVLAAGGSFAAGGYNTTISTRYRNPLAGRTAWSGDSRGFLSSTVNFPASIVGHSIQLAWRLGCDRNTGAGGWYVDSIFVSDGDTCCLPLLPPRIFNTRKAGTNITFSYGSVRGQAYIVESKFDINSFPWVPLRTNAGDGSVQSYTNTTPHAPLRLFRLRTQLFSVPPP